MVAKELALSNLNCLKTLDLNGRKRTVLPKLKQMPYMFHHMKQLHPYIEKNNS